MLLLLEGLGVGGLDCPLCILFLLEPAVGLGEPLVRI